MKRKSDKEKRVQGTARPDRVKAVKVVSLSSMPQPAAWLEDDARVYYRQICKHLQEAGALHDIDSIMVSMCANALFQYARLAIILNRPSRKGRAGGVIQVFKTGARQVSPEFTALKEFAKQYQDFSKLLGLDPKSREALLAFTQEPEEERDPLDDLLGEKAG